MHLSAARLLLAAAIASCISMLVAHPASAAQADRCPGSLDVPTSSAEAGAAADAVVCLVNAERTSRGLKPLGRDGDLAQAARRHAADMVRRNYFSHTSPSGTSFSDRIRAAGYGSPGDGWK